jgi:hypothetical protein
MKNTRIINADPAFFKNYFELKPFSENYRLTDSSSTLMSISSPKYNIT